MNREEAIQRAMKLLKLSESSNVHEAALAAQRAQELLARFNITQEIIDAEANGPREKDEPVTADQQPLEKATKMFPHWKQYLGNSVARANQCRVHTRTDYLGNKSLIIVGRASDSATARYLYQVLCNETERLVKRQGAGRGRTWYNNFRLGVVDAITTKLNEAEQRTREAMRQEVANNCTALVKVDNAIARIDAKAKAVELWQKQNLRLHKTYSRTTHDPSARHHGRVVGSTIQINPEAKAGIEPGRSKITA